eukprot:2471761-Lingulodinium_polyedra.AAC.1
MAPEPCGILRELVQRCGTAGPQATRSEPAVSAARQPQLPADGVPSPPEGGWRRPPERRISRQSAEDQLEQDDDPALVAAREL